MATRDIARRFDSMLAITEFQQFSNKLCAQTCLHLIENVSIEELKEGKKLLQSKVLEKYAWTSSSTSLCSKKDKIDDDVATLSKAKQWSTKFTDEVQHLAKITTTDSNLNFSVVHAECGVELALIYACQDNEGQHFLKVIKIDHGFTLAPEVNVHVVKEFTPIHKTLKSRYLFGLFEKEYTKQVDSKTMERTEKVVTPPKATASEFDAIIKYLKFKVCATAIGPLASELPLNEHQRQKLEWDR